MQGLPKVILWKGDRINEATAEVCVIPLVLAFGSGLGTVMPTRSIVQSTCHRKQKKGVWCWDTRAFSCCYNAIIPVAVELFKLFIFLCYFCVQALRWINSVISCNNLWAWVLLWLNHTCVLPTWFFRVWRLWKALIKEAKASDESQLVTHRWDWLLRGWLPPCRPALQNSQELSRFLPCCPQE